MSKYVLITPANNEEFYIGVTIDSVLSQSLKPARWIIVDDGSTDYTAEVVSKYLPIHKFIRLLRLQTPGERNFGRKVAAFNAGLKLVKDMEYSFIGNLDADISLPPTYYEDIIGEFRKDPKLGIAGGVVYSQIGRGFATDDTAPDSVGGAVQLFRKECFDQIGGYIPLKNGGIDAAAEIIARMKGWTVRKFRERKVHQRRQTGSVGNRFLAARYKEGVRFHSLGYSTVFYLIRAVYKLKIDKPSVIASVVSLLGFLSARVRNSPVSLPPEAVSYLRSEQARKLKDMFFGAVTRKPRIAE